MPSKVPIRGNKNNWCWLYILGVDSGKANIMASLKAQEPGAKYCHFPRNVDLGYDETYFKGLLSEKLVYKRENGKDKWKWELIPGHKRNEALDCRNYAMAAFRIINPQLHEVEKRLKNIIPAVKPVNTAERPLRKAKKVGYDDW